MVDIGNITGKSRNIFHTQISKGMLHLDKVYWGSAISTSGGGRDWTPPPSLVGTIFQVECRRVEV